MAFMWGKGTSMAAALSAVLLAVATPNVAASSTRDAELAKAAEVAHVIADAIPGARLRAGSAGIDPLFNVPGLAELTAGRAEVMADPNFWVGAVSSLLQGGSIILPTPIDVVKPEAFLPTAPVADGPYVSALPRRDRDLSKVTYEWRGERKTIQQYMRTTETDIVAFARDGAIVADFYENGWSADVRHQPWSVTKSFISTMVGIAVDEGRIRSIDEPVEAYLPELRGTRWEGVTIRNVLEMESGVHWDEDTPVLALNTQVEQWVQAALDLVTQGQLGMGRNEFLMSLPSAGYEQGTRWKYNSGNTQVLAWLTERVYGKPFAELLSEKLWQPMGMDGDARILTDRVGDAIASQGLYSRVFDLMRFGEVIRRGGVTPEGRRVVSARWVREATAMTEVSKGTYAYQFWSGPTPLSFEASGFQGQKISIAPNECMTGVRLSHAFGLDTRPKDGDVADPDSYGFGTEFGSGEWDVVYRAAAEALGGTCPGAAPPRMDIGRRASLSRRLALRRGGLRVRLAWTGDEARTVRVRALAGDRTVATRRVTLRPQAARWVTLPLTRAGRALLRTDRRLRVVVRAGTATRRITVR